MHDTETFSVAELNAKFLLQDKLKLERQSKKD